MQKVDLITDKYWIFIFNVKLFILLSRSSNIVSFHIFSNIGFFARVSVAYE